MRRFLSLNFAEITQFGAFCIPVAYIQLRVHRSKARQGVHWCGRAGRAVRPTILVGRTQSNWLRRHWVRAFDTSTPASGTGVKWSRYSSINGLLLITIYMLNEAVALRRDSEN